MSDSVAVLIAAGIIIPIVLLLIYAAFRNFFTSARNLTDAIEKRPAAAAVSELVAHIQAEAKKSDDAHKARIRAHVERTIPPIGDDGRKMIERARRACLAIRHIFPPRLPQRGMSYFGGLPIVPDDSTGRRFTIVTAGSND